MELPVPGGDDEVVAWQNERRGEMERIEAAQVPVKRELGGVLDDGLVDLDNAECRPLLPHGPRCTAPGREADGAYRLDEPDAADVPALGSSHRVAHQIAFGLGDVALDERSASR